MALKAYNFVGLSNPVNLPDDIQVEIAIVTASMTNIRSNQKRGAAEVTTYTQHETANFNAGANADMHKRWLHSGAGGAYVGFNFVVDDRKIIQLTPLDEVTWAAGTPTGNRTSDHSELCVNNDIDHAKARRNAAALAGGVLKARGLGSEKVVQHHVWFGKNCPLLMRQNGEAIWKNTFMPMVREFHAGTTAPAPAPTPTPPPATTYAAASVITEVAQGQSPVILNNGTVMLRAPLSVKAKKATPRLRWASASSEKIGPDIPSGSEFVVSYLVLNADGTRFWYTPFGTRVKFEDTEIVGTV